MPDSFTNRGPASVYVPAEIAKGYLATGASRRGQCALAIQGAVRIFQAMFDILQLTKLAAPEAGRELPRQMSRNAIEEWGGSVLLPEKPRI